MAMTEQERELKELMRDPRGVRITPQNRNGSSSCSELEKEYEELKRDPRGRRVNLDKL